MATYCGNEDRWCYDGPYVEFTTFEWPTIFIEVSGYDEFSWQLKKKLR